MADKASFELSVLDYDNELSRIRCRIPDLDAASYAATTGLVATLIAAMGAIGLGVFAKSHILTREVTYGSTPPSDQTAQRETKWLIRSQDTVTNEIVRHEFPCADLTLLTGNSDTITDFTPSGLAAFKAAWEDVVESKAGNPVTLISLQHVGKRL